MSDMSRITLSSNGTAAPGPLNRESLMIMVTGSIGGGTLNIKKYSIARQAYVTVATYAAITTEAEELKLGRGKFQFELVDATTPALDVDYWAV